MMRRHIATRPMDKGTKRRTRFLPFILLCSFVPLFICAEKTAVSQDQISIRWTSDPADPYKVVVEIYGLSEAAINRLRRSKPALAEWRRLFSIYAGQER